MPVSATLSFASMHDLLDDSYPLIEEYGIIGDLKTAGLVGREGSLDFLCWPRFNAPSIFAAHVDRRKGGRFQIKPRLPDCREKKLYLPDTNILLSRFLSDEGIAEVSDFMLRDSGCEKQAVVRRTKSIHGRIHFSMICQPRFDYARTGHALEINGSQAVFREERPGGLVMRLCAGVNLTASEGAAVADFTLEPGQTAAFVFEEVDECEDRQECLDPHFVHDAFKRTANYWRSWIRRSRYRGRWREAVNRSALALKLLTSREYGSIIAAPCFGFPNEIGGERNWDYRFTWVRDASFTTYGLMRLGFTEEADAFMRWLEERCIGQEHDGELQIMYQIDGQPVQGETHLGHLDGYRGSRPIRVGSTNHGQLQLDIYGELLDSVYMHDKFGSPIAYDTWQHVSRMVDFVCRNWHRPDASIWEVRSEPREFLYSRIMCWVTLDRAIRLARKRSLPAPVNDWLKVRDAIYQSVFEGFWNQQRRAFVQFKGGESMDASTLIMPLVRMISPTDPRWHQTMKAITEDLVTDSLVYRYRVGEAFSDELEGSEGTFSICSLWYIESISRMGDLQQARFLFEKMQSYGNELGLFSEQLSRSGEFLGNIPQAFTHLSLISAAFDLNRRLGGEDSVGQVAPGFP